MSVSLGMFVLVFGLALGLTAALTPLTIHLGKRWGMVALPGGRRKHKGAIVRIGGLPLLPAFAVAALAPVVLGIPRDDPLEVTRLLGVLAGMGIIWVVGLLDDKFNLPPLPMILGLVLAAGVAMYFKVFVELFNNPFGEQQVKLPWYLMIPLSLAWIVGMSGTVNFLDGLDGLACGVTAISSAVLFIHMLRLEQYSVSLLPLALLGCCLGFLLFNYTPARIFLGGGAYLLGFALAAISIVAGAKVASALLVLWVPIIDVVWQVYSRWRRDQPLGIGDRGHLHLRLQDLGWSQSRIVLIYYAITATLGAIALMSSSRVLKFAVLLGGALLVALALAILARRTGEGTDSGR